MGACFSSHGTADASSKPPHAPSGGKRSDKNAPSEDARRHAKSEMKATPVHNHSHNAKEEAAPPAPAAPAPPYPSEEPAKSTPDALSTHKEKPPTAAKAAAPAHPHTDAALAAAPAAPAPQHEAHATNEPKEAEKNAAQAPEAAHAAAHPAHDGPPAAQPDRKHAGTPPAAAAPTSPPAPPLLKAEEHESETAALATGAAKDAEQEKEKSKSADSDSDSDSAISDPDIPDDLGNRTKEFRPSEVAHATTPPPSPTKTPAEKPAEAAEATPQLLPAPTPTSADAVTPERQAPPPSAKHDNDEEHPTRGPSTARVEEVPPTPINESETRAGKTLPADDARVLMRAPPPPPPPLTATATTAVEKAAPPPLKASESTSPTVVAPPLKASENKLPTTVAPPLKASEAKSPTTAAAPPPPNALVNIIRRQQEEKQRYPTALTTDAADDAPLEISMNEKSDALDALAAVAAAAAPAPPAPKPLVAHEEAASKPPHVASPGAAAAAAPPPSPQEEQSEAKKPTEAPVDVHAPTSGTLYKILSHAQWSELRQAQELRGTPEDKANGHISLATADQACALARDLYSNEVQLVLLGCSIEALSIPENYTGRDGRLMHGSPLRWEASFTGERAAQLYRPLRHKADVLWFCECANGSEVVEKVQTDALLADSSLEDEEENPNEEYNRDAAQDGGDVHEDQPGDAVHKPISFTDTSELERDLKDGDDEGAEGEDGEEEEEEENEQKTPSPAGLRSPSVDEDRDVPAPAIAKVHEDAKAFEDSDIQEDEIQAEENGEEEDQSSSDESEKDKSTAPTDADEVAEGDKPRPVAADVVPAVALAAPAAAAVHDAPAVVPVVTSTMTAPEQDAARPVSPRSPATSGAAPPRRVPPSLPPPPPSPQADADHGESPEKPSGDATPPPTRAAPQTIMSPPTF